MTTCISNTLKNGLNKGIFLCTCFDGNFPCESCSSGIIIWVAVVQLAIILWGNQWRREAKCRQGPTIKVPPFPPLEFNYKNLKWKIMFRA